MLNKIKYWLQDKEVLFASFGDKVLDKDKKDKRRVYIDRDSKVLFVAHLDTIQEPKFHFKNHKCIHASGLDDRLGCLIADSLSKELKVDLLLTDNEETGLSTAMYHKCKSYNWIMEFDRHGGDVVTYDLDNAIFRDALREFWTLGLGSFSDVCMLDSKSCCVNVGIGYEHDHSVDSFARIETIETQIEKVKQFHANYKDSVFVRDVKIITPKTWNWNSDYHTTYGHKTCDMCGMPGATTVYDYDICEDCFLGMLYEKLDSQDFDNQQSVLEDLEGMYF
jgi:hypothetical protein